MTILFGSAQASISESVSRATPAFVLMAGGLYLHQSGLCLQKGRKYAWQGTIEQARAIRRRFDAAAGCRAVPIASITPKLQPEEAE